MATLSSLLVQRGSASMRGVEDAIARQVISGGDLATNVLEVRAAREEDVAALAAEVAGIEPAPPGRLAPVDAGVLRLLPGEVAARHGIFPLEQRGRDLVVATSQPLSQSVEDDLGFLLNLNLRPVLALRVRIEQALAEHYGLPIERRYARLLAKLEGRQVIPDTVPPRPPSRPPALHTQDAPRDPPAPVTPEKATGARASDPGAAGTTGAAADDDGALEAVAITPARPTLRGMPRAESSLSFEDAPTVTGVPVTDLPETIELSPRPPAAQLGSPAPTGEAGPSEGSGHLASITSTAGAEGAVGAPAAEPAGAARSAPEGRPQAIAAWARASDERAKADRRHGRARRKGPFPLALAEEELQSAVTTEAALEVLFDFAQQYFEYTAFFVVHGDLAEGRDAAGRGADRERVTAIGLPLDLPSTLSAARERRVPVLSDFARDGLDLELLRDLGRAPAAEGIAAAPTAPSQRAAAVVIPIVVRERAVALLFGDDAPAPVELASIGEVIAFAALAGASIERIILRKKISRSGGSAAARPAPGAGAPAARGATKVASEARASSPPATAPSTAATRAGVAALARMFSPGTGTGASGSSAGPSGQGSAPAGQTGIPAAQASAPREASAPPEPPGAKTEAPAGGRAGSFAVAVMAAPVAGPSYGQAAGPAHSLGGRASTLAAAIVDSIVAAAPDDGAQDAVDAPFASDAPRTTTGASPEGEPPAETTGADESIASALQTPPPAGVAEALEDDALAAVVPASDGSVEVDDGMSRAEALEDDAHAAVVPASDSSVEVDDGMSSADSLDVVPGDPEESEDAPAAIETVEPDAVDLATGAALPIETVEPDAVDLATGAALPIEAVEPDAVDLATGAALPIETVEPDAVDLATGAALPIEAVEPDAVDLATGAALPIETVEPDAVDLATGAALPIETVEPDAVDLATGAPPSGDGSALDEGAGRASHTGWTPDTTGASSSAAGSPGAPGAADDVPAEDLARLDTGSPDDGGDDDDVDSGAETVVLAASDAEIARARASAPVVVEISADSNEGLTDAIARAAEAMRERDARLPSQVPPPDETLTEGFPAVTLEALNISPDLPPAVPFATPPLPGLEEPLASVTLDALLALATRGPETTAARAELARRAERNLAPLLALFPGPLDQDRHRSTERLPPASECGPLLQAFAHAGARGAATVAVLARHDDVDVRFWAAHLLGEIPSPEAVDGLLSFLVDPDPAVRRVALRSAGGLLAAALPGRPLEAALGYLARDAHTPLRERLAAVDAMGQLRMGFFVPILIGLLSSIPEEVGESARRSLLVVTRQDFGRDAGRWNDWWSRNEGRHRLEWLIDALMHDTQSIRRAAGDELKQLTKEYFGYYDDLPKRERERAQDRYRQWWEREGRARFR